MHDFRRRTARGILTLAIALCWFASTCHAQSITPVITVDHGLNSPQQITKPYVVLVSLDGFRYDYAKKYHAEHLLALAARGASAPEGMIPSYPSITFPNHYTIATGLYPEHHGIVGNDFYDPTRKQSYGNSSGDSVLDGTWYGGTPLWVLAEQQGMRSASFFWVGSEAEIQGMRPTYYLKYDRTLPNPKRVEQVLAWLHLPPEQRPHMITLYFSDVDSAGHHYGPDSPQVADAVHELDTEIGKLDDGIRESKLPVDLIVLADHGMAEVKGAPIDLPQLGLNPAWFTAIDDNYLYPKSEEDAQKAFEALRGKSDKFNVYRRSQVPPNLHFDSNPREGDPVIVTTGPYLIAADHSHSGHPPVGMHGYDPTQMPEMKALFLATGPDVRPGFELSPFENVNVYPLIARILDLDIKNLKTGPIDGNLSVLDGLLLKK